MLPVISQDSTIVSAVPTIRHEIVFAICRLIVFISRSAEVLLVCKWRFY